MKFHLIMLGILTVTWALAIISSSACRKGNIDSQLAQVIPVILAVIITIGLVLVWVGHWILGMVVIG
jgi:asparagine N-glycosylation enzyme membrane subunit Stt3